MKIKFTTYNTALGAYQIGCNETSVVSIRYIDECDDSSAHQPTQISDQAHAQLEEYFNGNRTQFDFPIEMIGTDFQKLVWNALCDIPYGQTRTYKQIAEAVGNPKACRAVGMANNRNPIAVVVPCHRVIGSNNKLVGYASGVELKKTLLDLELTTIQP